LVNDSLGVQQIYKTKPGGSVWVSTPNGLLSDPQFSDNGASISSNGDGTYHVKGKSRMNVFCSVSAGKKGPEFEGYSTFDYEQLRKNGTWDDATADWKNVEMTAYVKFISQLDGVSDECSWVVRSVRHNTASHSGCGGSSYHGNLHISGFGRFKKEDWHVSYQNDALLKIGIGGVKGKTIGLKFVLYNINNDEAVKLELYVDKDNNNTWIPFGDKIDAGDWSDNGPDMKHCGALSNTAIISWGSPKVIWKWNGIDMEISKMSVREIIPGEKEDGTTPPGGGSGGGDTPPPDEGGDINDGGTGTVTRINSRYVGMYDVIVDSSGFTCTGSAPPSGSGTYIEKTELTVTTITDDRILAKNRTAASGSPRTEVGWYVFTTSSKLKGLKPTKIGVYLKKAGSPTGTLHVYVLDSSRNIKVEYGSGLDVSTLTTAYVLHETDFINDSAPSLLPNGLDKDWMIAVKWDDNSGTDDNHVTVGVNFNNPVDSTNTGLYTFEKASGDSSLTMHKFNTRDMAGKIYTSP
jgi:hypothetical protein